MEVYRLLKEGEIVRGTDEYYSEDQKQWIHPGNNVGALAPDPTYSTSHRLFRRRRTVE